MKKFFIILILVCLSGCSNYIQKTDIEKGIDFCKDKGGFRSFKQVTIFGAVKHNFVLCNNGTESKGLNVSNDSWVD